MKSKRRDFEALERRRLKAGKLFAKGESSAEVVRRCQVSFQSVRRWRDAWEKGGAAALRAAGRAGRKRRLDDAALAQVEVALKKGPQARGFATALWTAPRIQKLIAELTGVKYHREHIPKLLRSLGWSCQRPVTRARERDEAKVAQWKRCD